MSITIKAYANADDVLIAWQPDTWSNDWVGFQLERRNDTTQQVTVLVNRIPPKPGEGPVQATGISSTQSPIRRCLWTDHGVVATDNVSYRVIPMKGPENVVGPDPEEIDALGVFDQLFRLIKLLLSVLDAFMNDLNPSRRHPDRFVVYCGLGHGGCMPDYPHTSAMSDHVG